MKKKKKKKNRMIIAFGHRRRVGKDVATRAFIDMLAKRGIPAVRVSFADGLKEVCTDIFGWAGLQGPEYYEEFPQEKEDILPDLGLSPRTIWVETGSSLRQLYEDVWIDMALNQPKGRKAVIIISDLRYPNEVAKVKAVGGVLVKVTRDTAPVSEDVADCALDSFDEWDLILDNNGTIDYLREQMLSLVNIVETVYGFPTVKKQQKEGED
jgi:hypothetical protein